MKSFFPLESSSSGAGWLEKWMKHTTSKRIKYIRVWNMFSYFHHPLLALEHQIWASFPLWLLTQCALLLGKANKVGCGWFRWITVCTEQAHHSSIPAWSENICLIEKVSLSRSKHNNSITKSTTRLFSGRMYEVRGLGRSQLAAANLIILFSCCELKFIRSNIHTELNFGCLVRG